MGKVETDDIAGYILTDQILDEVKRFLRKQGVSEEELASSKPWNITCYLLEHIEKKISYVERMQMLENKKVKVRLWNLRELQQMIAEQYHRFF